MVWSPPSARMTSAFPSVSRAPLSMCSMASARLNGFGARSPASATWSVDHGETSIAWWYARRSFEPARIACGPNLAPGRYVTPESNGTPRTATRARSTSWSRGSRANVSGPTNRGRTRASGAPIGSIGDTLLRPERRLVVVGNEAERPPQERHQDRRTHEAEPERSSDSEGSGQKAADRRTDDKPAEDPDPVHARDAA